MGSPAQVTLHADTARTWDGRLRLREYLVLALGLLAVALLPPANSIPFFTTALVIYAIGESTLRRRARLACLAVLIPLFLYFMEPLPYLREERRSLYFLQGIFLLRCVDYVLSPRPAGLAPQPGQRLPRFFLWIFFFPALITPMVMYRDFYLSYQPWIANRRQVLAANLLKMLIGAVKIVCFSMIGQLALSDGLLQKAADLAEMGTPLARLYARLLAADAFSVDLMFVYFRFSGLCDITIGLSRILGFNIPENFNYGLLARTPAEYWKNMNIAIHRWLMTHVFFPFWGHRQIVAKVLTTFVVSILWHCTMLRLSNWQGMVQIAASSLTFGVAVAVVTIFQRHSSAAPAPASAWRRRTRAALQIALTFCFLAFVNKAFWNGWIGRPIDETLSAYRLLLLGQR
jgi:D-alanyl-lipoteichoic acid acyltransferase DltB (MBOAT superfamily)